MDAKTVAGTIAAVALIAALYLAYQMKKAGASTPTGADYKKKALMAGVVAAVAGFFYYKQGQQSLAAQRYIL